MLYAIVAVIALILDQAVKYWTTVTIPLNTGIKEFIPGIVRLTCIHNTGAAFSFLEGARWFFVAVCVIFTALLIFALAKNLIETPVARWMAVIVMAGAVGNCIDRIVCGYVVDMFELEFMRFPVFNVADIYITVGAVLFALCVLFEKNGSAEKPAKAPKAAKTPAVKAPSRRRFKKTPIPVFPAHEHVEEPKVDPNDPFAEWERRAAEKKAEVTAREEMDAGFVPAAESFEAEKSEAETAAAPSEETGAAAAPAEVKPAAPAPAVKKSAPAAPVAPATAPAKPAEIEKAAEELSFNLDDILAEFRDL